ncbi:unnamed protein product [Caenorhabditis angaria]|uniref:Uncharacterized protein n=1 Tax=Caenorhabditis angaria TaxID=860376 RepID=A0A9P1J3M1_9PELO|nr:unnamed protein product [Caenorhabditis angaria]
MDSEEILVCNVIDSLAPDAKTLVMSYIMELCHRFNQRSAVPINLQGYEFANIVSTLRNCFRMLYLILVDILQPGSNDPIPQGSVQTLNFGICSLYLMEEDIYQTLVEAGLQQP